MHTSNLPLLSIANHNGSIRFWYFESCQPKTWPPPNPYQILS